MRYKTKCCKEDVAGFVVGGRLVISAPDPDSLVHVSSGMNGLTMSNSSSSFSSSSYSKVIKKTDPTYPNNNANDDSLLVSVPQKNIKQKILSKNKIIIHKQKEENDDDDSNLKEKKKWHKKVSEFVKSPRPHILAFCNSLGTKGGHKLSLTNKKIDSALSTTTTTTLSSSSSSSSSSLSSFSSPHSLSKKTTTTTTSPESNKEKKNNSKNPFSNIKKSFSRNGGSSTTIAVPASYGYFNSSSSKKTTTENQIDLPIPTRNGTKTTTKIESNSIMVEDTADLNVRSLMDHIENIINEIDEIKTPVKMNKSEEKIT